MTILRIEPNEFPSGQQFKRVLVDGEYVGSYEVHSSGYVPFGARKIRPTEFEAILDVIAKAQRKVAKRVQMLDDARDEAFQRQREFGA